MASISDAVGAERVSRVVGYKILPGQFQETTPNLPMRIAVLGQANTANQTGLTNDPVQVTSEQEAGNRFGFGSQIHIMMRILRARTGDITGGIPTIVYPQLPASGAAAQVDTITVTGAATAAATHLIRINGRTIIDGDALSVSIVSGDAVADVASKIADTINACNSCPVTAAAALGVVTMTSKWQDVTAGELTVVVDTQETPVGLSYAVAEVTPAAGDSTTNVGTSLALFGENWNTIVVNPYGKTLAATFENFNGVPGVQNPAGRYLPNVFLPFIALTGDKTSDTVANVTSGLNANEATLVQCPAPGSEGWSFEAAANYCVLLARQAQENPAGTIAGRLLPDMPGPLNGAIGVYGTYNNRDAIVKEGGSTVTVQSQTNIYRIEDFVTTYHPVGQTPLQFSEVRNLLQDWNVRYTILLLEQVNVVDKTIIADDEFTTISDTVKPKQWRAVLTQGITDLSTRAIITDIDFSVNSLQVGISSTNPNRFETFLRYKRTGVVKISSTTVEAGFNFGELQIV